jgi:hypothetical protein
MIPPDASQCAGIFHARQPRTLQAQVSSVLVDKFKINQ